MATLKKTIGSFAKSVASFFRRPIGRALLALAAICAAVCGRAAIVTAGRARRQARAS